MLFRVWDKKNNRYSKEDLLLDKDGDLWEDAGHCLVIDYKNYEVEFNTGITLADGTETFFGDIVRWKDSMFDSRGGDGYRYWILKPELLRLPWVWTDLVDGLKSNVFEERIELVGNIHETELTDAMKVWIGE